MQDHGAGMQDLHTALWSSYLGLRDKGEFGRVDHPGELPMTLNQIVTTLGRHTQTQPGKPRRGKIVVEPLLGLAVWNLVSRYREGKHPKALEKLSERYLRYSVEEARRVVLERGPTVLPRIAPGRIE